MKASIPFLAFLRVTTIPLLTIFSYLAATLIAQAQPTHDWSRKMGGIGSFADAVTAVAYDPDGNLLATGDFEGTSGFTNEEDTIIINTNGSADAFVAKYDPSGQIIWARGIGGSFADLGVDITTDAQGNVYVTGHFRSAVDFSTNGTPHILDATSIFDGTDVFLVKYNPDGDLVWAHQFGDDFNDEPSGISIGQDGHLYVSGLFRGEVNFNTSGGEDIVEATGSSSDIFLAKFTTDAELVWVKRIGGSGQETPKDMAVDLNNNVFLTGIFTTTTNLDPSGGDGVFTAQSYDGFIAKYDTIGELVWAHGFGGSSFDFSSGVAVDNEGSAFIVGNFWGTIDMDSGVGEQLITSNGNSDVFLAKYSASGESLWAFNLGGNDSDEGRGVTTNDAGNVFITGTFGDTADFDPSENTAVVTSNGFFDVFVAKYSSEGEYEWAFEAGGPQSCYGNAVAHDGGNLICVGGYFSGPADFDPLGEDGFLQPENQGFDGFVAQYVDCSAQVQEFSATICPGETYELGGNFYTETGIYALVYEDEFGCDVSASLNLDVVELDSDIEIIATDIVALQNGAEYQWYQCDEGLSMLPGEMGQSFSPTGSGSYAVEITYHGCSVLSECLPFVITSINQVESGFDNDFWVYPNPAADFTVVRSQFPAPVEMRILDVAGRQNTATQIIVPGGNVVSTVDLIPGIYVFQFIGVDRVAAINVLVK